MISLQNQTQGLNMTPNDVKVLNEILEGKRTQLAPEMSEPDFFQFFAAQQVLRNYQIDADDIQSGLVDGDGDGGIDLFISW